MDNPNRIQSASAQTWGKYDISQLDNPPDGVFKIINAGFDPAAMHAVPDRVISVYAMRYFENQGKIGKLYDWFYVTMGTGTTQAFAAKFGREIAEAEWQLHTSRVGAALDALATKVEEPTVFPSKF